MAEQDETTKIYVIEDNRTENLLIRLALSALDNVEIKHFEKGQNLIDALPERPHIAIVDLNLPDINGFDVIKKIREDYKDIKIVVVSAQRSVDVIAKVQALGVYNYLVKSEGTLKYMKDVLKDLITIIKYRGRVAN